MLAALLFLAAYAPESPAEPRCPKRVVSLALASDEILIDLLADRKRIAALTYLASDPYISNIAEKVPDIPQTRANLEQLLSMSPDLVIVASYTNQNIRAHLASAGIKTVVLHKTVSFESIKKNIMKVGKAVCEEKAAQELVNEMERKLEDSKLKILRTEPPRILYYGAPGFTVGTENTINDIIEHSGAINIPASIGLRGHSNISTEYIASVDPDIILTSTYNPSHPDFVGALIENPVFRSSRTVVIAGNRLDAASHYIVLAVEDLVEAISAKKDNVQK